MPVSRLFLVGNRDIFITRSQIRSDRLLKAHLKSWLLGSDFLRSIPTSNQFFKRAFLLPINKDKQWRYLRWFQ